MNDVPFHLTVMGRRFYEAQLPALIAAIERLGDQMGRIGSVGGLVPTRASQGGTPPGPAVAKPEVRS